MKLLPIPVLVLFCSAAIAAEVNPGTYLEQEVVMEAVSELPSMKGVQKIWFTDQFIRSETTYEKSTSIAIFDLAGGRVLLLQPEDKRYFDMKLTDYQRIVGLRLRRAGVTDPAARPKLTSTGEQKTIGQWSCTRILFQQAGTVPIQSELWVAKDSGLDFGAFLKLMQRLGTDALLGPLAEFAGAIQGYPIEVKTTQVVSGLEVVSTTRILKIAVGPVDPTLFKVPEGYKPVPREALPKN
jgi:hypothetical protein